MRLLYHEAKIVTIRILLFTRIIRGQNSITLSSSEIYLPPGYEINIVIAGKGIHYIGEMEVQTCRGDVFVLPPNSLHGYRSEDKFDVLNVLIKREFIDRYRADLCEIPGYSLLFEIEPYLRHVHDKNFFLRLDAVDLRKLLDRFDPMLGLYESRFDTYKNFFVLDFIADLSCKMYEYKLSSEDESVRDNDILRVMEYISNHFAEKLSIEALTEISNMSRPTFHRRFRSVTRMTPTEYIIKCRLNEAKFLLARGKYNRAEIAQKCGFYDTSHMNKCLQNENDNI